MKKYLLLLCATFPLFADIDSSREVLKAHTQGSPAATEVYDRLTDKWASYAEDHPNWDFEALLRAVEFAAIKHEGQVRKNGDHPPYVIHPMTVSELLWDIGGIRSANVLVAALLHDNPRGH